MIREVSCPSYPIIAEHNSPVHPGLARASLFLPELLFFIKVGADPSSPHLAPPRTLLLAVSLSPNLELSPDESVTVVHCSSIYSLV